MRRIGSVICANVVIFGILTSLLSLSGCGDSPESNAAKQVHEAVAKATNHYELTGDFEKSYSIIDPALSKYGSKAGGKADSGYLVAGDLMHCEAQKTRASLSELSDQTNILLGQLSNGVVGSVFVNDKQIAFENLLTLAGTEAEKLKEILNGDSGLEAKLAEQQGIKAELEQQRAELAIKFENLKKQRSENQNQADSKLKGAELASDEELISLEKQAYDLLRANTKLHIEVQRVSDQIDLTDAKLKYTGIMVAQYQAGIASVTASLEKVGSTTDRIDPLKNQLELIQQRVTAYENEMKELSDKALASLVAYEDKVQETANLYEKAIGHYKNVRTRGTAKEMADHQLSECYVAIAEMYSVKLHDFNHLSSRFHYLLNVSDGEVQESLTKITEGCTANTEADKLKAYENYDLAVKGYEELRGLMGREPETACSLAKSAALAYYGKLTLSDLLEDYDTSDAVDTARGPLMELLKECDPKFDESVIVKLFTGDLNYIPAMTVPEVRAPVVEEIPAGDGMDMPGGDMGMPGGPGMPGADPNN